MSGSLVSAPEAGGVAPGRRRVPPEVVVALLAVLCAVAAAVWLSLRLFGPEVDERPVTLPDTFAGRERIAADLDFGRSPGWLEVAREAVGDAGFAGAAYGEGGRRINVVAARADTTGKLDQHLATDLGDDYGGVRCTNRLDLSNSLGDAPVATYDGLLLCWRTSPSLSVTAFVLGGAAGAGEVAPAVQALWDTLQAG